VDVRRTCDRLQCDDFIVPRLFELNSLDQGTEDVLGTPLNRVRKAIFRTWAWRIKRCFDVVFAAAVLVVLLPLLLSIALAVRLDGGPIVFRQERVGLDGRLFRVLKFRSLAPRDPGEATVRRNIRDDARLGRGTVPTRHLARRTAAAVKHSGRGHELRRATVGAPVLRLGVRLAHPALHGPTPGTGWADWLGAGARATRRHIDRGEGSLRQLLHRELIPMARREDCPENRGAGVATCRRLNVIGCA